MSSSDLQTLLSTLKPRSQERHSASPSATSFVQQSSRPPSSAFFQTAPVPSTPPPPFSATSDENRSGVNNDMAQKASNTNGATAQNLLNLLNFSGSQNTPSNTNQTASAPVGVGNASSLNQSAPISASDLVARFMSPTISTPRPEQKEDSFEPIQPESSSHINPLLELLNRQANAALTANAVKAAEKEDDTTEADVPVESVEAHMDITSDPIPPQHQSSVRIFGSSVSREPTPFDPPKPASPLNSEHKPIFTYKNPFEALNASRHQTPTAQSPIPQRSSPPAPFEFHQTPASNSADPISTRKKLTPKPRSQRSTTSAANEQSPVATHEHDDPPPGFETNAKSESVPVPVEAPPFVASSSVAHETVDDTRITKEQEHATDEIAQEVQDESGEWEDAEDSPEKEATPREVLVYNFPIKAFISITLQLGPSSEFGIREDGLMEISRLKKDFDQLDRSLAAATSKYITYAFVKNGGMRIIRQDDGQDRQVFKNSHDRIFNVAFCAPAANVTTSQSQAVLGTGISGAVYYANIFKESNDLFEENQLDTESLIFPPYPQADENTAGGVLKTRAKRSSRHPEYFAIGRGKFIHLIWPATAFSSRYGINDANRTVDVEKYYADRPLQISTGKAGKDFTFSDDDTLIVSLDKTGRLRFWDIRTLVDESNAAAARIHTTVVDTPILSLSTASPAEKSWPTSVTFVDKARPYKKGGPLRYVLVGLRQNHTLQLWDIALGKAVQELNFPHENETDGICSVNYHPESGIIVVSHPTRNSIFFIHLSAPKYSLSSSLSQAVYVQRIAAKDPELPKPESTACMSGIREISFAEKGQLRSVELLSIPKSTDSAKDDSTSLFELYCVHSRGVTCLSINREDLGWNSDNKVLYPVDAQAEGLVTLKELKLGSIIEEPIRSKSPLKEIQQPTKASKKKPKKTGQAPEDTFNGSEELQTSTGVVSAAPPASVELVQGDAVGPDIAPPKESKKAKKKAEKNSNTSELALDKLDSVQASDPPRAYPATPSSKPEDPVPGRLESIQPTSVLSGMPDEWLGQQLRKIEQTISDDFKRELDYLYANIRGDRAAQDSSAASRQEAILKLVSSSLSNNVEKSLSRILAQQIQQAVVPVVVQQTSVQVAETLTSSLHQIIPQEVGTNLSTALNAALQNPHTNRTFTESITQRLSKHVETQMNDMIAKSVTPIFKNVAVAAAEKASSDTEARLSAQIRQLQLDRAADNDKLDRLSGVIQGMASTLQAMSDAQVAFQAQILRDRQTSGVAGSSATTAAARQVSTARGTPDATSVIKPKPKRIRSKADIELEEITHLMNEGRYEEGSIKWLQSAHPVKLFDELFVRFTPEYLATDVSPLVAFSVAVTVANSFDTNTERRLEWILAAFDAVDVQDPEITDLSQHAPALITSLVQKLESLYMTVAERNPSDPVLRIIPPLAKKGRDMKTAFISRFSGSLGPNLPPLAGATFT